MKRIALGCDHAALNFKKEIKAYLESLNIIVKDFGTYDIASVDYPDYAFKVGEAVVNDDFDGGILLCGTGVGMSIAANKVKGVRAVVCSDPFSAKASREHNNSNVLCLGARVIGVELAKMIVQRWLEGEYQGERHAHRVNKITEYESR